ICREACDTYVSSLQRLRLPHHSLRSVDRYPGSRGSKGGGPNTFFWDTKSKAPYVWGDQGSGSGASVPWLAFVGYQIRRDGRVRVRKASIDKELYKQRRVATDILKSLR